MGLGSSRLNQEHCRVSLRSSELALANQRIAQANSRNALLTLEVRSYFEAQSIPSFLTAKAN